MPAVWLWGPGLIRDCKSLAQTVQQGNLTHQSSHQLLAVLDSADAEILRAASDLLRLIPPFARHQPGVDKLEGSEIWSWRVRKRKTGTGYNAPR